MTVEEYTEKLADMGAKYLVSVLMKPVSERTIQEQSDLRLFFPEEIK